MKYFVFENDGETYIVNANEVKITDKTVNFYCMRELYYKNPALPDFYNIMVAAFRLDAIIGFNEMTEEEDE